MSAHSEEQLLIMNFEKSVNGRQTAALKTMNKDLIEIFGKG